ncbi:MAG: AI-2E family transporter [Defluviitaleaceae bacterium]|nr:AI-2E family transporter [Defluviitaleaceae bacterium]
MKLMNREEFKRWFSSFLLILAGIIAFTIIGNIEVVGGWLSTFTRHLSPFVAGFIMAYLLDIPCSALERRLVGVSVGYVARRARGLSVMVTLLVAVAFIALTLVVVIPEVVASIQEFSVYIPAHINNFVYFVQDLTGNDDVIQILGLQTLMYDLTLVQIFDFIGYDSILAFIVGVFGAATFVISAVIAIISTIYILLDARRMKFFFIGLINSFVPVKTSSVFFKYLSNTNENLKTFIYCMVVDSLILVAITVVTLSIMRVDFSLILALIIGISNFVPYFGSIVGSLIVILVVFLSEDVGTAVAVAIFLLILQQIDANVIKVKLFGDSFDMSPFLVIFSITIGGAYYGIAGMVLAIPIVAMIKTIFNDLMEYRRRAKAMDNRR